MFTRVEIELAGLLLMVAGFFGWLAYHDHQKVAEGEQIITQQVQTASAAASAVIAAKAASQAASQSENLNHAITENAQHAIDGGTLDAIVARLRQQATASPRPSPTRPQAASSPGQPASVPSPDMVPRELFLRAVQMASDAAKYADCLRTAGKLCSQDYGALTP